MPLPARSVGNGLGASAARSRLPPPPRSKKFEKLTFSKKLETFGDPDYISETGFSPAGAPPSPSLHPPTGSAALLTRPCPAPRAGSGPSRALAHPFRARRPRAAYLYMQVEDMQKELNSTKKRLRKLETRQSGAPALEPAPPARRSAARTPREEAQRATGGEQAVPVAVQELRDELSAKIHDVARFLLRQMKDMDQVTSPHHAPPLQLHEVPDVSQIQSEHTLELPREEQPVVVSDLPCNVRREGEGNPL